MKFICTWREWRSLALAHTLTNYLLNNILYHFQIGRQNFTHTIKLDVSERHECPPSWILRRFANVSPFFNFLSNRLRITNYCLRSVSSSFQYCLNKSWYDQESTTNFKAQRLQVGQKSFNRNKFQNWSVAYDYILSYQKSSQYLKS
jgi:hypothetical protein